MGKSIMADYVNEEPRCYFTGSTVGLDKHHAIFGLAERSKAEKDGLWVYLRHDIHMAVHQGKSDWNKRLKQDAQRAYEKTNTREEWMRRYGKNYL